MRSVRGRMRYCQQISAAPVKDFNSPERRDR
jgi:hypothetical protein